MPRTAPAFCAEGELPKTNPRTSIRMKRANFFEVTVGVIECDVLVRVAETLLLQLRDSYSADHQGARECEDQNQGVEFKIHERDFTEPQLVSQSARPGRIGHHQD